MFRLIPMVLSLAFAAPVARAHEGHAMARVIGDVLESHRDGLRLDIFLRLDALEHDIRLYGISVDGAEVLAGSTSADIRPGHPVTHAVSLMFTKAIPGLFTLILDFGEDGQGPVLVVPD